MARDSLRIRMVPDREKRIERAKEALRVSEDSKAIDLALEHLVQSIDSFEDVKEDVTPELAERLSTSVVRLAHYPQVKV